MEKASVFQHFMKALKSHWKRTFPEIRPLTERQGLLPKSSSFDAGIIPATGQHVYLEFQTTSKEAGYFTINLVIADAGAELSVLMQGDPHWESGQRLAHGAHRIREFLGERDNLPAQRHDKWWHLCEVIGGGSGPDPEFFRNLRLRLRESDWTAPSYENETQVIAMAVEDVTRDVRVALKMVGIPTVE